MMSPRDSGSESAEAQGEQGQSQPGNYKVGYGRPPKAHRFRPGVSGNPAGRKKSETIDLEAVVQDALAEPMTVRANGKERRMTSLEALLWSQMQSALHGKLSAVRSIIRLAKKAGRFKSLRAIAGVLIVPDPEQDEILAEFHALKAAGDPRADLSRFGIQATKSKA